MDAVIPFASVGTAIGIFGGTAVYEVKKAISPDLMDFSDYFSSKRRLEAQKYGAVIGLASGTALGLYANTVLRPTRKKRKA